ncbi:MAG: 30S ribosomal protein S1 [Anaerolineae bacterium]|jgi:small subunit ribosomal protein S1|nr:30S ribosomal protein S1 [Anaerolineae bacterium]MBT4311255.1 30S ribosomal protein S1 [Anaerolineae bacterium]MBT4459114.1 30S ribosomal protein S1 [Anaerolineae bacterium]MBT4840923.1 30S ribosomal protein S1 [Anaerolineae bacterium]MBT6060707.1 30S ribosomal protein S1 [Anaerolineae bacterium]
MKTKDFVQIDDNWWASVLADEKGQASKPEEILPIGQKKDSFPTNWEKAQKLYKSDALISLQVIGHNRGGVLVEDDDLSGFVPYSHLLKLSDSGSNDSANRDEALASYCGETLNLKLIECAPEEDRLIFSERAAQAGAGKRQEVFSTLRSGAVIEGEVSNITDFGVFVDIGGVEGLVHKSELSWGRVGHPSEIVQLKEKIRVQVLDISLERNRVALSLKQLFDNPWEKIQDKYQPGQSVFAEITAIVSFGAFARLEEGIEGLIHSSEIPLGREGLQKGDEIKLRILQLDAKKQRMSLSLMLEEENG